MDVAVGRRPGSVHIGDIEQSGIGATRKARRQLLPDRRMRAITAGEVGRVADLLRAVRALEDRAYLVGVLLETDQRRAALHVHPPGVEPCNEQPLVDVLRVGQRIGKGAHALPYPPQGHARGFGAPDPESDARNLDTGLDDRSSKVDLSIEFQGAGLDGHRARGGARLGGLVHDPHWHPEPGQPEGEHEAGGPRPDDQYTTVGHRSSPDGHAEHYPNACDRAAAPPCLLSPHFSLRRMLDSGVLHTLYRP
jgi:hypothetical protein